MAAGGPRALSPRLGWPGWAGRAACSAQRAVGLGVCCPAPLLAAVWAGVARRSCAGVCPAVLGVLALANAACTGR
jgi:hypothetical protein